ncbi:MAG: FAD-binding protein [Bacteroidetes bacterium]|nr:FAD-binding protein [Bacteroidota bacterium]
MGSKWSNWSGSVRFQPNEILYPENEAEVAAIVKRCAAEGKRIRTVGAAHSFTRLIETGDVLISLDKMSGIISVDKEKHTAVVWAGTRLRDFGPLAHAEGLALVNQGDIDVQSVAGAFSTGTHGTGLEFGTLSTCILGLTLVTANGEILQVNAKENAHLLPAVRISLGCLGIITRMELQLRPIYKLKYVAKKAKLDDVLAQLEDYKTRNRNFEFYWFPFTQTVQTKETNITDEPPKKSGIGKWLNDILLENGVFWILSKKARFFPFLAKTAAKFSAWGVSGSTNTNWSHLVYATKRLVRFQEMEYNLPTENFIPALKEIVALIEQKNFRVHFPLECRWAAPDDNWLSPAQGRHSSYIAVHMYKGMPHRAYFDALETILKKYGGRPHWGKMHTQTADSLAKLYPNWADFHRVRKELDPKGVFLNDYLKGMFGE